MQFDKDPTSSDVVMVVVSDARLRARVALRFGISGGVLHGFDSTKAWTDLFLVRTREQRKAELDDARRDLELRKVTWGSN